MGRRSNSTKIWGSPKAKRSKFRSKLFHPRIQKNGAKEFCVAPERWQTIGPKRTTGFSNRSTRTANGSREGKFLNELSAGHRYLLGPFATNSHREHHFAFRILDKRRNLSGRRLRQ